MMHTRTFVRSLFWGAEPLLGGSRVVYKQGSKYGNPTDYVGYL